jgi:hypothetical protein
MPRMRLKPTKWALTGDQRAELTRLLDGVDPDAGEGDPTLLALLGCWWGCEPPWDAFPLAHVYQCKDGTWITDGVATAVGAIQAHVEAPMPPDPRPLLAGRAPA